MPAQLLSSQETGDWHPGSSLLSGYLLSIDHAVISVNMGFIATPRHKLCFFLNQQQKPLKIEIFTRKFQNKTVFQFAGE